ncbi:MAG: thioredoxin [Nitrososphaeria archaeon]
MPDEELDKIMEKYEEMLKDEHSADADVAETSGKILYHIGDSDFDQFLKAKKDMAVDFYADWCGPCKIMSPIFDEVANEISPKISFAKVNVDDSPNTAEKFSIMGVPTVLYFKSGSLVDKTVGAIPKNTFRNKIKEIYGI